MNECYAGFAFFVGLAIGAIFFTWIAATIAEDVWIDRIHESCITGNALSFKHGGIVYETKCEVTNRIVMEEQK